MKLSPFNTFPYKTGVKISSQQILTVDIRDLIEISFYDALQALPASRLGVFFNIEPLVTALVASVMIGEALTLISLMGGAIIIFGVWLVNRKG